MDTLTVDRVTQRKYKPEEGDRLAIHKLAYQVRRIRNYNVVSMLHFQWQLFWLVVIIKSELASILLKSFVILKKLHRDIMIKILKSDKGKNVS